MRKTLNIKVLAILFTCSHFFCCSQDKPKQPVATGSNVPITSNDITKLVHTKPAPKTTPVLPDTPERNVVAESPNSKDLPKVDNNPSQRGDELKIKNSQPLATPPSVISPLATPLVVKIADVGSENIDDNKEVVGSMYRNFFAENESLKKTFVKYDDLNIDTDFVLNDITSVLSSKTISLSQRDTLLREYFNIIESIDPKISDHIPLDEKISGVKNLFNQSFAYTGAAQKTGTLQTQAKFNSRFAEILKFRAIMQIPEIQNLSYNQQFKIGPLVYLFDLMSKYYRVDIRVELQKSTAQPPYSLVAHINQSMDAIRYEPKILARENHKVSDLIAEVDLRVKNMVDYVKTDEFIQSVFSIEIKNDLKINTKDESDLTVYNHKVDIVATPLSNN